MADTLTTNAKLIQQANGDNDGTWGDKVDENWAKLDSLLGDMTSITTVGGTDTLSDTEEFALAIKCTATLTSNLELVFSGRGGKWVIWNATSGAYTVTALVSGQTGVVIPQGEKKIVFCDGTDIRDASALPQDLGTGDSPQFAGINLGHASDTTITRASAGNIAVEGKAVYRAGGTDVAVADGGTGRGTAELGFRELANGVADDGFTIASTVDRIIVKDAGTENYGVFTVDALTQVMLDGLGSSPAVGTIIAFDGTDWIFFPPAGAGSFYLASINGVVGWTSVV